MIKFLFKPYIKLINRKIKIFGESIKIDSIQTQINKEKEYNKNVTNESINMFENLKEILKEDLSNFYFTNT